jgi:phasin family protein
MAATKTETTVEQMTAATNIAFKDGVEKTLTALNEANSYSKKNLEALVASVTAATKGAEALGAQSMAFSKQAFETQVSAARAFAGVKSFQEAVELQTSFAKSALESYMSEAGKFSETLTASVKETVKPLNERVTDAVERLQAVR